MSQVLACCELHEIKLSVNVRGFFRHHNVKNQPDCVKLNEVLIDIPV